MLLRKTLKSVVNHDDTEITFTTTEGEVFKMFHSDGCCEVKQIDGDLRDLVGSPILISEKVTVVKSATAWTFYKFATIKGYVTISWESRETEFYSDEVDFIQVRPPSGAVSVKKVDSFSSWYSHTLATGETSYRFRDGCLIERDPARALKEYNDLRTELLGAAKNLREEAKRIENLFQM